MENPIKMDDLGGPPLYLETPTWFQADPFRMSAVSAVSNAQDDPRFLSLTNQVLKGCGCGSVSSYILHGNISRKLS